MSTSLISSSGKWRTIRDKLNFFAEKTTVHGIPNYVRTDLIILKVLWGVCLLLFAGYCAYTILLSFLSFFAFEVNTNIEILRDSDADFPAVSLCILQACGLDKDGQLESNLAQTINQEFNATGQLTQTQLDEIMKTYNLEKLIEKNREFYLKNKNSKPDLYAVFGRNKTTIKQYVISCVYSSEYCYENDFVFFQTNEFQRCYKFNSGKNYYSSANETVPIKKARRYGKTYGLQLEMFIGAPHECKSLLTSNFGLMLYVHNSSTAINYDSNGVALAPGMQTSIAIDRTFVSKMPAPYSNCVPNDDTGVYPNQMVADTFSIASSYTQFTCMQICYQQFLLAEYQCYDRYLPMVAKSQHEPCPLVMDSYENIKFYNRQSFYQQAKEEDCLEKCPQECVFITYDRTASSSQFPSVTYAEVLSFNENVTSNFEDFQGDRQFGLIESSVLAINVFYKNDLYTRIKEKPALEWDRWISNIGGNLGLFLGAGFLSLIELFEVVFEVVLITCCCFSRKKDDKTHKKIFVQPVEPLAVN